MALPILAGAAILHGLRIVGLRIIPYLVKEGTKIAAKQAGKKVGAQKVTETGYIVVTNNPTKFKLAQKIFGNNKVFKSDVLSSKSTASRSYEAITGKSFKKLSPEIKRTVANQADDAANSVSKFIIQSPTRVTSGEKVAAPFNKFFGQNIKFTDRTLKNIKLAEQGPTALGKEIVTTGTAKKAVEEVVKAPIRTGTQKVVKTPDVIALGSGKAVRQPLKMKESVVPVKEVMKDPPWYVAAVPNWLRTSTRTVKTTDPLGVPLNPYIAQTVQGLNKSRTLAAAAGGTGVVTAAVKSFPTSEDMIPGKTITTELDAEKLFGGTGPIEASQLETGQAVEVFDE